MASVLLIEPCDFDEYPKGGQLCFAKQMAAVFGPRLALVGISTDTTPVGRWVEKRIGDAACEFLSVGRWKKTATKPIIPSRIHAYLGIRRHRH